MEEFENMPYRQSMINKRNRGVKKRPVKHKPETMNEHVPSFMESKIADYLDEIGEDYICEKVFQNCVSLLFNVPLPFDFYLPKRKLCLESDGIHHYRKMRNDKNPYSYDRRVLNDKTRELFCIKRGIKLVRISYKDFINYKEIINEALGFE